MTTRTQITPDGLMASGRSTAGRGEASRAGVYARPLGRVIPMDRAGPHSRQLATLNDRLTSIAASLDAIRIELSEALEADPDPFPHWAWLEWVAANVDPEELPEEERRRIEEERYQDELDWKATAESLRGDL